MTQLFRWLSARPLESVVMLAIASDLLVGVLERATPMGGTLWVLHFVPVGVVAWYVNRWWAMAIALGSAQLGALSAPAGLAADLPLGAPEAALRGALLIAFVLLVAESRKAVAEAREPARSDPSTGLASSGVLFELVSVELERAQRYGRSFTLVYIGIDNMPAIRHWVDREAAEEVMRRIAHQIRGSLRTVDMVARLREREFAVLLPETGMESAGTVLGRVQRALNAAVAEESHPLSFAVGATTWLDGEIAIEALHQRTYQLMHAARSAGVAIQHQAIENGSTVQLPHRHLTVPL